jgi:tight adherence protein B
LSTIANRLAGILRFGQKTSGFAVAAILTFAIFTYLMLESMSGLKAFAIGGSVGLTALVLEIFVLRAKKIAQHLESLAPIVANSFASSFSVGATFLEAFEDLAKNGPPELRELFQSAVDSLLSGHRVSTLLRELSNNFQNRYFDLVFMALEVANKGGNSGSIRALKELAGRIRIEQTMHLELRAKQQWVGATARLAVASPWVVVLLLSMRPEARAFYETAQGVLLLMVGLLVSVVAYRAVSILGRLPLIPRVFA